MSERLNYLIKVLQLGNCICVAKLSRIASNMAELSNIYNTIQDKGCELKVLDMGLISNKEYIRSSLWINALF